MARIVAVANQKGGVGKTTTAVNLASSIAYFGHETLLVDLDPQANATSGLGFDKRAIAPHVYDVLIGEKPISEVLRSTMIEWLDLVPSHIDLIGVEVELVSQEGRELRLKNALSQLDSVYEYVILDCPPSLGLVTLNALCAAHSVLIPLQCEYYAMEGMSQLMDTISRVRQSLNPDLDVEGILLTMYDSRIKLSNDVVNEVRKVFSDKVYSTFIPRNIRLAESPGYGKPVLTHDFSSKGSQSYIQLAHEFLKRNGMEVAADFAPKKKSKKVKANSESKTETPELVSVEPAPADAKMAEPASADTGSAETTGSTVMPTVMIAEEVKPDAPPAESAPPELVSLESLSEIEPSTPEFHHEPNNGSGNGSNAMEALPVQTVKIEAIPEGISS